MGKSTSSSGKIESPETVSSSGSRPSRGSKSGNPAALDSASNTEASVKESTREELLA